jgi:hypothetical protein
MMTKEHIALGALLLTILGLVWSGGQQLGTMRTTIEHLTKETALLRADLGGINQHLIAWVSAHQEPASSTRRGGGGR